MLCNVLPRHNWAISAGVFLLEGFIVSDYRACCGFHFIAAWAHWWAGSSFIYSSWDPFTLILLLLGMEEDKETPQSYLKYSALSFWWWFGISLVIAASPLSPDPGDFSGLWIFLDFLHNLDCATGLDRIWPGVWRSLKGWKKGETEEQTLLRCKGKKEEKRK